MSPQDLRIHALLRNDIIMNEGKCIAQAGHAYLDTCLQALTTHPEIARTYAALRPGTKIALACDLDTLLRVEHEILSAGLPCVRVIDRDHVHPPDFNGSPVLTALGVGPLGRAQARRLLADLPLWPGRKGRKGGVMT